MFNLSKQKKSFWTSVFPTETASCFGPKVFKARVFPESFVLKSLIELVRPFPCVVGDVDFTMTVKFFCLSYFVQGCGIPCPTWAKQSSQISLMQVYLKHLQRLYRYKINHKCQYFFHFWFAPIFTNKTITFSPFDNSGIQVCIVK